MRRIVCVVLIALCGTAAADGNVWDRTYKAASGGGQWPCPVAVGSVTVKDGTFSIPFDVATDFNDEKKTTTIGRFEGSVRPSGLATMTLTYTSPSPRAFVAIMQQGEMAIDKFKARTYKIKFDKTGYGRTLEISGEEGGCYSQWKEDRDAAQDANETGTASCAGASAWSAKRAYASGEVATVATAGGPLRLYRCIDECKRGAAPKTAKEDNREVWAFVGECEGQVAPEAALPATGSATWDTKYKVATGFSDDWRCPAPPATLVVSKGKFSMPWRLRPIIDEGEPEPITVGRLDGVIAADGKTTLRTTFTVKEVPPEIAQRLKKSEATLQYVRTAEPAITFFLDTGKKNPNGQGRRATFTVGTGCELAIYAVDYKPQQFREADGWRVTCNSDMAWESSRAYQAGDLVTVTTAGVKHQYRCNLAECAAKRRPGNASMWERIGRCSK